jgi:hypothetical protein
MAATNDRFTLKIYLMTGEEIKLKNIGINFPLSLIKNRLHTEYRKIRNDDPLLNDMRLLYMIPDTGQSIELVAGSLGEHGIHVIDSEVKLELLIQPIRVYDNYVVGILADLFNVEHMADVPENTTVVDEVSPDLNFKTIYILNETDDKKGLRCTVKSIFVNGPMKQTILDVHIPNEPDFRLSHLIEGDVSSSLLDHYVQQGRVKVEHPAHGGRKKRTRRNRRTLLKKHRKNRTHRKHRKH